MNRIDNKSTKNQIELYTERQIEREKYERIQKAVDEFDVFGSGRSTLRQPNQFDDVFGAVALEKSPPQRDKSDFDDIFG